MNKKLNEAYNSLSEVEKKSYNSIMDYFTKVMNQITNKTQREEFMKKFKDSLKNNKKVSNKVKKLTALALSTALLLSPVMLAGCDEEMLHNFNNASQTSEVEYDTANTETGNPSESIDTDSNGAGLIIPEGPIEFETVRSEDEVRPITTEVANELNQFLLEYDISGVLNGEYSKFLNDYIPKDNILNNYELLQEHWLIEDGVFWGVETVNYFEMLKSLVGEDAKYCVNIDVPRDDSGAKIEYYREGNQTATFIVTDSNGTIYYNGIINGNVYTEGQEFLSGMPNVLTEENKVIIEQMQKSDKLGALIGDSLVVVLLTGNRADDGLIRSLKYDASRGSSSFTRLDENGNILFDEEISIKELTVGQYEKDKNGNIIGENSTEIVSRFRVYRLNGEKHDTNILNSKLQVSDSEGNNYIIANLTYDYNPENIKLPTTEAEAER